jgi:tRNA-splicing endonuclease subunit Sen34
MDREILKLSLINGKVMTFDADDYMKIRSEHHIVGKLIGVPVSHPRNHLINGLPALFTDFETKLLLENGLAVIEDKTELVQSPSEEAKQQYQQHKENILEDLQKPYIESRLELTKFNMDKIINGKIKKLIKSGVPQSGK